MILKGINIGGWLSQAAPETSHWDNFIKEDDVKKISRWGFNSIRLPFDFSCVIEDERKMTPNRTGINHIVKTVEWAKKYNMICILDFHVTPWHHFLDPLNNKKVLFFKDNSLIEKHIEVLDTVMQHIYQQDHVYLEILNEPQSDDDDALINFYRRAIITLRNKNYNNKIVVDSNLGGNAGTIKKLEPLCDLEDIIYSFHFYQPEKFTHQKAYWTPQGSPDSLDFPYHEGNELIDEQYLINRLKQVIEFKEKTKKDVFCGEFGVYLKAPHNSRLLWIDNFLKILSSNQIGYLFWTYKNLDFGLINNQKEFKDLDEYNNAENIDYQLLSTLVKYI